MKGYMLYDYMANVWVNSVADGKITYTSRRNQAYLFKTKKEAEKTVKGLDAWRQNIKIMEMDG